MASSRDHNGGKNNTLQKEKNIYIWYICVCVHACVHVLQSRSAGPNSSRHTSKFSLGQKSQDLAKPKRTVWSSIHKLPEHHISGSRPHLPQMKLIQQPAAVNGMFSINWKIQFHKWQNGISVKVEEISLQLYRNKTHLIKVFAISVSRQVKHWASAGIRVEPSQHLSARAEALWRQGLTIHCKCSCTSSVVQQRKSVQAPAD